MRRVTDNQMSEMLGAITDPKLKTHINRVLKSQVVKEIHCDSKICKGAVIGTIDQNEQITPTLVKGKMYMRAYRKRLDGGLGIQCWCSNDSRLAPEEKGVPGIEQNAVTKSDLEKVWNNLGGKIKEFVPKNGITRIDGFSIVEVHNAQ